MTKSHILTSAICVLLCGFGHSIMQCTRTAEKTTASRCVSAGAPAWLAIGIPTVPRKGGTDYLTLTIGECMPATVCTECTDLRFSALMPHFPGGRAALLTAVTRRDHADIAMLLKHNPQPGIARATQRASSMSCPAMPLTRCTVTYGLWS